MSTIQQLSLTFPISTCHGLGHDLAYGAMVRKKHFGRSGDGCRKERSRKLPSPLVLTLVPTRVDGHLTSFLRCRLQSPVDLSASTWTHVRFSSVTCQMSFRTSSAATTRKHPYRIQACPLSCSQWTTIAFSVERYHILSVLPSCSQTPKHTHPHP